VELGTSAVANELHLPAPKIESFAKRRPLFIALIGRPGSGKTTIAHELSTLMPSARLSHISDLQFLSEVFALSDSTRFVKTEDNGFFITDKTLYDEALADLANHSKTLVEGSDVIIAEFARSNYALSLDVLKANGIEPDLIVYVGVSFPVAYQRNKLRASSRSGHYVSDREMTETYMADDIESVRQDPRVAVIPNEDMRKSVALRAAGDLFEQIRNLTQSA
jgi:adenylate kinase family enzyme